MQCMECEDIFAMLMTIIKVLVGVIIGQGISGGENHYVLEGRH